MAPSLDTIRISMTVTIAIGVLTLGVLRLLGLLTELTGGALPAVRTG